MLTAKKDKKTTENTYTVAKKADVLKAISKSNKKHAKMFSMLAQ